MSFWTKKLPKSMDNTLNSVYNLSRNFENVVRTSHGHIKLPRTLDYRRNRRYNLTVNNMLHVTHTMTRYQTNVT